MTIIVCVTEEKQSLTSQMSVGYKAVCYVLLVACAQSASPRRYNICMWEFPAISTPNTCVFSVGRQPNWALLLMTTKSHPIKYFVLIANISSLNLYTIALIFGVISSCSFMFSSSVRYSTYQGSNYDVYFADTRRRPPINVDFILSVKYTAENNIFCFPLFKSVRKLDKQLCCSG
jgi:hypothetical protein